MIAPDAEIRTIFTQAGSASALSRSATCRASSSLIGQAATGAQHTGAEAAKTFSVDSGDAFRIM